jgi:glycosyltransferase involved in cell wall biosynthesis
MKPFAFLLVSPGPVDGYPPVQYQARLMADAGHAVTLVTMPLHAEASQPKFSHPGVDIRCVSPSVAFGRRTKRMWHFARALWLARRSQPRETIEIAYDPIGCFYSDVVPEQPRWRIAHLHELLQQPNTAFLEKRLKTAIRRYDLVVVPDISRGVHTQRVLDLRRPPLVLENYPLLAARPANTSAGSRGSRFEVVYCGTLGLNQKLDVLIRSIPSWPDNAVLILIGNNRTQTTTELQRLAEGLGVDGKVHFLGWMDTPDAETRLTQADLGVALLDTKWEQWRTALTASNKRFQYMKAGLPQIGDTNPGVPELLDGIGACVGIDHNPEQIATLVKYYAGDPLRCAVEGARAFERHKETYNYERVFRRLQSEIEGW